MLIYETRPYSYRAVGNSSCITPRCLLCNIVSQGTHSMHVQGHELSALWNQYDFLGEQDGAGLIVQWTKGLVHCDNCWGGIIWVPT